MSDFECEICGERYTSYRAMMLCEEECIDAERVARRPVRSVGPKSYVVAEG